MAFGFMVHACFFAFSGRSRMGYRYRSAQFKGTMLLGRSSDEVDLHVRCSMLVCKYLLD